MKKLLTLLTLTFSCMSYANETPTLSLSAQGTLYKPADELQMNVGVITIKETAEKALKENSQKMAALIKNLEAAGLSSKDYETGRFSITPTYTPYPKNPPSDWKQSINGYEVSNSLHIHTELIDLAGILIDAANQAGANNINDIRFVLQDQRMHWQEAISLATANAISDAETMARSAGLRLVRVMTISLDSTPNMIPRTNLMYSAKALGTEGVIPPIESGDVTVTANVSIVYEIGPAK